MRIDRTTKVLLALIALGLWANAVSPLWSPRPVAAQDQAQMEKDIHDIAHDLHNIWGGICINGKIC
jgi:hypothetical protein